MSDVPRDPGLYHPTDHAVQRQKERKFEWHHVATTIQDGEVWDKLDDDTVFFVKDFHFNDKPLAVVANVETGEIITVEWRKE